MPSETARHKAKVLREIVDGRCHTPLATNELVLHGVMHQLGIVPKAHLLQDPRTVRADGFYAQRKLLGDFTNDLAGSDQAQNLELAVGKQLLGGFWLSVAQVGGQLFRQRRADVAAAGQDLL